MGKQKQQMKSNIILTIYILVNLTVTLRVDNVYEVIIVGAGISGLRASQILASHKIPHLIIQSTNHIGGRIASLDFQGIKVDKGASFIHHSKAQNPLGEMVKNMGLPWINGTYNYEVIYYQNETNNQVPLKEINDARQLYFDIVDTIFERLKKQKTMMRADVLKRLINREFKQQSQLSRDLVNFMLYVEDHVDGSSIEKLSTKMKEYKQAKQDISLTQGMHQFFHTIFKTIDAPILFNKRVTSIDYSGTLVKVQTFNETFYAKKVLSSLPLGVLKQNTVKFIPSLGFEYQKAIQNIGVSIVDKLFVSFERPFWSNNTRWISFLTKKKQNRYPVAFIMPIVDKNILQFFVTQQDSLKISNWSKQELIRDLYNFLTLFHKKTTIWIRDVKLTKWHEDENAYGSYSKYSSNTSQDDYTQLSKHINQKLWFIGEHTHTTLNSYAHGAYLSAQNAAEEVAQIMEKSRK